MYSALHGHWPSQHKKGHTSSLKRYVYSLGPFNEKAIGWLKRKASSPGSQRRWFLFPDVQATKWFVELLQSVQRHKIEFHLLTWYLVPVRYDREHGPGSFSGFWVTRSSHYDGLYRTKMVWNVYACLTGTVGMCISINEYSCFHLIFISLIFVYQS